jgi:hypothetical protein
LTSQNHCNGFLRFDLKTGDDGFLVEPKNQDDGGFSSLILKTGSYGLVICVSKLPRRFLDFSPQNQTGLGLSVVPQNQRENDGVRHVSRSAGLLCVKTSLTRVFQSGLKTGGGVTAGGTRGIVSDVASESS